MRLITLQTHTDNNVISTYSHNEQVLIATYNNITRKDGSAGFYNSCQPLTTFGINDNRQKSNHQFVIVNCKEAS